MKYILNLLILLFISFAFSGCADSVNTLEGPQNPIEDTEEMINVPIEIKQNVPIEIKQVDKDTRSYSILENNNLNIPEYSTLWRIEVWLQISDDWNRIFNILEPIFNERIVRTESGHSIKYNKDTKSFDMTLRLPKRINPNNIQIGIALNACYGTEVSHAGSTCGTITFKKNNHNKLQIYTYFTNGTDYLKSSFYYLGSLFNNNGSWSDIDKTQIILRNNYSNIVVISDNPSDHEVFNFRTKINPYLYHNSNPVFLYNENGDNSVDAYQSINCLDYTVRSNGNFIQEDNDIYYDITTNYISLFWKSEKYDSSYLPRTTLPDNTLAFIRTPFSESGNLPVIYTHEDSLKNLEGERLRYIVLIKGGSSIQFLYAVIPLPEKMYPRKNYIFRNKPGTKIFSNVVNLDDFTRGENQLKVMSPEDIIIEEYDMDEELPIDVAKNIVEL